MGFLEVLILNFVALGPALVLFLSVVAQSSVLVILSIAGSFLWTLGFMVTSLTGWATLSTIGKFEYLYVIPLSIFITEIFRIFCVFQYRLVHNQLSPKHKIPTKLSGAIALGWGMGIMQILVTFQGVLIEATGPGTLVQDECPLSTFNLTALLSSSVFLTHIALTIIAMQAVSASDDEEEGKAIKREGKEEQEQEQEQEAREKEERTQQEEQQEGGIISGRVFAFWEQKGSFDHQKICALFLFHFVASFSSLLTLVPIDYACLLSVLINYSVTIGAFLFSSSSNRRKTYDIVG